MLKFPIYLIYICIFIYYCIVLYTLLYIIIMSISNINILSLNCQGLKGNIDYIDNMLLTNSCDIIFLCEHWLRPSDMYTIKTAYRERCMWSNLKSAMLPTEGSQAGRPYGGVGFVSRKLSNITYRDVPQDDARLSVIELHINGVLSLTVIGAYMPYHCHNSTTEYSETLDKIQGLINNTHSPYMIVGDMNATLPEDGNIGGNWYKTWPYTKHSVLLYDLICNNDLFSANFSVRQNVKYTYFKGQHRSYIDHVFMCKSDRLTLVDCVILPEDTDLCSDHLPIKTVISVRQETEDGDISASNVNMSELKKYMKIDWSIPANCEKYKQYINIMSEDFLNNYVLCTDITSAQCEVNNMYTDIVNHIQGASNHTMPQRPCGSTNQNTKSSPWWSQSTKMAKNRKSLWYGIWSSCGKPRSGHVYNCYKLAKSAYRQAYRLAFNTKVNSTFSTLNRLHKTNNSKKFWGIVKQTRRCNTNDQSDEINLDTLMNYYTSKFSHPGADSPVIRDASIAVEQKYTRVQNLEYLVNISAAKIVQYIKKLNKNSSPDIDGITAEHLVHGIGTVLIQKLSMMLSMCIKYGVVPDRFRSGILVPIPKKPGCDASIPKNWRPIVISSTLSKLLELYVLDECQQHTFSDMQYGFVPKRGTDTATTLLNDVIAYSTTQGSTVYTCSLDAEGAFDAIPHSVLFDKASQVLPDHCWRAMYNWYADLTVRIKWKDQLSPTISVNIGTRQGGLSSPFLFNIFYQDLVEELSGITNGICIDGRNYNVFCYADDIMLTSLTSTGLQVLIDTANRYITEHGLRFNPNKTTCTTFGTNYLQPSPIWHILNTPLTETDHVTYLGTILSNSTAPHINSRVKSARGAFYSLQGAGLCKNGVDPSTISHIFNTAIRPTMIYGCSNMNLENRDAKEMDKQLAALVKSALGLPKWCRNHALLNSLGIKSISGGIVSSQMANLKSAIIGTSQARHFYRYLLYKDHNYNMERHSNLLSRVKESCQSNSMSFLKYVFDDKYAKLCKSTLTRVKTDGITDSLTYLFQKPRENHELIKLLLKPF